MMRHLLFLPALVLSGGTTARADEAALADITALYTRDGLIELHGPDQTGYSRAWACPDFAMARAVVALLQPGEDPKAKTKAFATIRQQAGCTAAQGRFKITDAAPDIAQVNWGYEAEETWQALRATDAAGHDIGLVFDSSPYAP